MAEQQTELDGMPEPAVLRRVVCDGRCVVSFGRSVVYDFDVADTGMRNLAVVALTGTYSGDAVAVILLPRRGYSAGPRPRRASSRHSPATVTMLMAA